MPNKINKVLNTVTPAKLIDMSQSLQQVQSHLKFIRGEIKAMPKDVTTNILDNRETVIETLNTWEVALCEMGAVLHQVNPIEGLDCYTLLELREKLQENKDFVTGTVPRYFQIYQRTNQMTNWADVMIDGYNYAYHRDSVTFEDVVASYEGLKYKLIGITRCETNKGRMIPGTPYYALTQCSAAKACEYITSMLIRVGVDIGECKVYF